MSEVLPYNVRAAADPHSAYETAQLCEQFSQSEMAAIDAYQKEQIKDPKAFFEYPLPPNFDPERRPALQRLIDNTNTRYENNVLEAFNADEVLKSIQVAARKGRRSNESASAIRSRRSVIACMLYFASQESESGAELHEDNTPRPLVA